MNRNEPIRDLNADLASSEDEHPLLTPCPCGEDAVWYRVVMVPNLTPGRGKPISAMVANDFYEDLCDKCFRAAFGVDEQAGWVRLPA